MDTSGRIHALGPDETDDDARARGLIPLTEERAARFRPMSKGGRLKAFAAEVEALAALHPLGRVEGLTEDDVRKLRNAAKRARRARRG